jgi:hypothetical protein
VVQLAPRIDERLVAAAARFDRRGRSIADINRLVGDVAEALCLPRPSYERIRLTVHELRAGRHPPRAALYLYATSLRRLPADVVIELLAEPERSDEILRPFDP